MHKRCHFKVNTGTMTAGMIGSSMSMSVEADEPQDIDGDVITGVIEFKSSTYARDQLLVEMICTLTDCCVELLKNGKQINTGIIYGLAINYVDVKAVVYRLHMDFLNGSMKITTCTDELPVSDSLNFLVCILCK